MNIDETTTLLEFSLMKLCNDIPFDVIAHQYNNLHPDNNDLITVLDVENIISKYVYDEVHSAQFRTVAQALKNLTTFKHPGIKQNIFRKAYDRYIAVNNLQMKAEDLKAERKTDVVKYNYPKAESYEGLVTQSNIEEDRIKVANRALRAKVNRYSEELVKYKTVEEIAEGVHNLLSTLAYDYATPKKFETPYDSKKEDVSLISIWSDFHLGEVVKSSSLHGFNEYNIDIAYARFKEVIDQTIEKYIQFSKIYNIDCLYIDILGDMFSGDIHEDLKITNAQRTTVLTVCSAVVFAQGISDLLAYVPQIKINCSFGNHSRVAEKKPFKTHIDNFDFILVQTISAFFKNEIKQGRIDFKIEDTETHIDHRRGFTFLLEHGDNYKSARELPGEIDKRITALTKIGLETPDFIEIGHFHTETEYSNHGLYINGSLKGTDEYVFNRWKAVSRPSQKLMVLSNKGIRETVNLYLSTKPQAGYEFDFKSNPVIGKVYKSFE